MDVFYFKAVLFAISLIKYRIKKNNKQKIVKNVDNLTKWDGQKMKNLKQFLILSLLLTFVLVGCNQNEAEKDSRVSLIKTTNPSPVQLTNEKDTDIAGDIKKNVMKYDEIYDVAVIKGKKDTLVVYKVKHLQRFRMKQIEKNINKLLEKNYPDENFTVSSDYKIFMEALELKAKVEDPKYSSEKAEKKLQNIIELKEERT
jgi:hypothetical protein